MIRRCGRLLALALLPSIGCACAPAAPPGSRPDPPATLAPVAVTRGSVTSVVTVTGLVEATPAYAVRAGAAGAVRVHAGLVPGRLLSPGQTLGSVGGKPLRSTGHGVLVEWLVPDGMHVSAQVPVVLVRYGGFAVRARLPAADAYRMYDGPDDARAQITGGPGPTACTPVMPAPEGPGPPDGAEATLGSLVVLCLLPRTAKVISGLGAVLGLRTAVRRNVLVLPVQTVAGQSGKGLVAKLVNGVAVATQVRLGITDGVVIEIVSGLVEGDLVSPYGPDLRVEPR
jgi:hypothetical protein